ncbi:glutamate-1-semialdehyde 2,1-aminomutase [Thalassotalea insulae]|uniref:Glutamate-1-semialdehyde 2,1-aminomutase n=1 Tax=Thalassotalea insulae TaxID=2056778 RepID=A0ABQ6GNQ9_9GAMM|nr:aminotransferase class III-fold pyridoxal phosphate-dependent enzyme [Thalassotalea insulae]GLX77633.1 glutamate-1-semialdehyde 2,1-aminomutase [Thalassotalea insulae]
MANRYQKSIDLLKQAEKTIPLGSQTFSKSKFSYPEGASPLFIERANGCHAWDVDGNLYIDFVSGLLSVSLGFCDPDIDAAVIKQIKSGVTFSLPHKLEMELAELIVELVPCAEMVRFGKNGSDATSAAIRLARAYTGREHVAVCGYHGWQDWYIGSTTRDLGVPEATKALTHKFEFNNIASLEKLFSKQSEQLAAVIMEPMNIAYPEDNFLAKVKELCHQHGTLLIFDETITGFRFALGGAQALFNVTPDLATLGKGMANGYPLSVVTGRKDIMAFMEDIFFSGTFAGETLSLAAAKTTIDKMRTNNVLTHIHQLGEYLKSQLCKLIDELNANEWLSVTGHPAWSFLHITDYGNYSALQLKSLLLQEMAARGILLGGGHNLNFAHQKEDIDALLNAYQEVLSLIKSTVKHENFEHVFHGKLLEPVFKVR